MQVKLLNREYSLTDGRDAINYISLLTDQVNKLTADQVRIGTDVIRTANHQRNTAEWLRQNWQGGSAAAMAGQGNAMAPAVAALAALSGASQSQPALPAPAPPPAPAVDPHKNAVSPPTITNLNSNLSNGGGTVTRLSDPPPTDRGFWVQIDTAAGSVPPGGVICSVNFGTQYATKPNVQSTEASATTSQIRPATVTTAGFVLSSPFALLPGQSFLLMINTFPNAGDSTF